MQRFLGELHFRSSSSVIARVSRIGGGLLPAIHGISSLHAAQVVILYHCRLLFCHRHPEEGFVAYVDYRPLDVEVRGQPPQARCYVLSVLVAVSGLDLRLLGKIVTV